MDDEPRIITVGRQRPAPDIAKWLREQPHTRRIMLCCVDQPSVTGEHPTRPSAFPCIDVGIESLVDGRRAAVLVRIADHQASDPSRLLQFIIEEATAAFADLQADADGQISER